MAELIHYYLEYFANMLGVTKASLQQSIFISLVAGFVFASIHLLTMLITRWGDRHATVKSLVFSFLLHLTCTFGILVTAPEPILVSEDEEDENPVETVVVTADEQTRQDEYGNTPVWEQLPNMKPEELARVDIPQPNLEAARLPEKVTEQVPVTNPELEHQPEVMEKVLPTPSQIDRAPEEKLHTAAIPMQLPNDEAKVMNEVTAPSTTSVQRMEMSRSSVNAELPIIQRGGLDRVTMGEFKPQPLQAPDLIKAPDSTLRMSRNDSDKITRREGPAPIMSPEDTAGSNEGVSQGGTPQMSPFTPRVTRAEMKAANSSPDSRLTKPVDKAPSDNTPTPLTVASSIGKNNSEMVSPQVPDSIRPNPDAIKKSSRPMLPETYRLRNLQNRSEVARKNGGTDESERAVELSLRWLASIQEPDGHWHGQRFGAGKINTGPDNVQRDDAGSKSDSGLTGLVVLAFLGAGYTQEEGPYAQTVEKALVWLVSQQREDGFMGGDASKYSAMYCHAMATFALAEAYGMQSDPQADQRLKEPIQKAVKYIHSQQNPEDGGWRYQLGQISDMSMFGWQFMALKSADIAGIRIPDTVKQKLDIFLRERSLGRNKGLAGYRPDEPPTPAMTAEALFCRQVMGIAADSPVVTEAVEFVLKSPPKMKETNFYYWYYGTLSMYQRGGDAWKTWNNELREILVSTQTKYGEEAGSWEPRDPWGGYGGKLYSTALATLCLEVPYRFSPINQNAPLEEKPQINPPKTKSAAPLMIEE